MDVLRSNLRLIGKTDEEIDSILYGQQAVEEQGLTYKGDKKQERALEARLGGSATWENWLGDRVKAESPAPTTETCWLGAIKRFAEWLGTDYVSVATKEDAANYRLVLLERLKPSTTKTELTRLKAWWNYAITHNEVKENIWDGLTRKLKTTKKKSRVDKQALTGAKVVADEKQDIGFYLQLFTGCRRGEHQGLRYCDVDLVENTIEFVEWNENGIDRRLKGGEKDERVVPIHTLLRVKLLEMIPDIETNNSKDLLFPAEWRKAARIFGMRWSQNFSKRYGFTSHELRANVVSQLQSQNVSPYFLYEITRYSVPGMSEAMAGCVRPYMYALREVIEYLK